MNVCLDIQSALARRAGVGRYTRMLAEQLPQVPGAEDLSLFYFDFNRRGLDFQPQRPTRPVRWIPGRVVQYAWKTIGFPPFQWFSGAADVYHFPNFILPPLSGGRSVVTIHDAAFLRYPETIEEKNLRYLTRRIQSTVERADALLCVSAFTARELQELLGVPADRLRVVHSGLNANLAVPGNDTRRAVRAKLGLDRPYLLSVGTLEPRKNYPFLIDVFDALDFDGDLVIAGMKGWKTDAIFARRDASPRRERIRLLEYVAEKDLAGLYGGAGLFVLPSLYEGFGFPPLEAMQCGTPVVAASTGSLPEVLGDAAAFPEALAVDAWKHTIETLLRDDDARARLSATGIRHAANFTWTRTAQETWAVYRSVI